MDQLLPVDPGVNTVYSSGDLGDDDQLNETLNTGGKVWDVQRKGWECGTNGKAGRNTKSMPIRKWKQTMSLNFIHILFLYSKITQNNCNYLGVVHTGACISFLSF